MQKLSLFRYKTPSGKPSEKVKYGMPSGHVLNASALMVWLLLEISLRGDEDYAPPWFITVSIIMVPVPWARWYNSDHTSAQCAVSLALGTVVGASAYFFRIYNLPPSDAPWKGPTGRDLSFLDARWRNISSFRISKDSA